MTCRQILLNAACAAALVGGLCVAARSVPLTEGFEQQSMTAGGQQRTYWMARPAASGPLPTILFLHGLGSDGERMQRRGFGQIGEREGFVTILPDAVGGMWSVFPPGVHYAPPGYEGPSHGGADTTFLKQLVGDLVARGISDPKRVYLGGMSFGGFMTLRMACVAPELFAAVGVVIASMPDAEGQDCHPAKPLPLIMINGTADKIVPYAGGTTDAGFDVWGTDRTIAFFRQLNGCDGAAQRAETSVAKPSGEVLPITVDRWTRCARGPVVLYTVVGSGHRAPEGPRPSPQGFNTAQTLWDFFRDKTAKVN